MKIIFVIILLLLPFQCTISQKINQYTELGAGFDPNGGFSLKAEYGINYKFIGLGLSGSFSNSLPSKSFTTELRKQNNIYSSIESNDDYSGKITNSVMLNLKIEVLKIFFPEFKHNIFISSGLGLTHYNKITHTLNSTEQIVILRHEQSFGFDYTLRTGYHYFFTTKISAGAYFEYQNLSEFGVIGLSMCRIF